MEWQEREHLIWGKGGREEGVFDLIRSKSEAGNEMFPRKQWVSGKFSIIPPCGITFDLWELYDGDDVDRFDSLEEAKAAAENKQ